MDQQYKRNSDRVNKILALFEALKTLDMESVRLNVYGFKDEDFGQEFEKVDSYNRQTIWKHTARFKYFGLIFYK